MATKRAPAERPVPTFDHLRKKKPLEREVPIHLDGDIVTSFQEAQEAHGRAQLTGGDVAGAQAALNRATDALTASTVKMRFRCIGRRPYEDLVRDHPPTEEQKKETPDAAYNVDTFSVALIAASCAEPAMTTAEVEELSDTWSIGEYLQLWMAALEVNTQRRVVDLGKGSSRMRG